MAAPQTVAIRQLNALSSTLEVIEKHDPQAVEQLRRLTPNGSPPNSFKQPDMFAAYLAEITAILAGLVDQHLEESKPRPRGRPRKQSNSS